MLSNAIWAARKDITLDGRRDAVSALGSRGDRGGRGARLFLPPYSPDFNPIEKAFATLKALQQKEGERAVSGPWSLIGRLVNLFQPAECAKYFRSCGYEPG